jgi:hypothetical protein
MDNSQKSSVIAYQRLFPEEKVYKWESKISKDFILFKVKGFTDFYKDITVRVEIIDYRYNDISKRMVDGSTMVMFKQRMKIPLRIDFSICSINNFDILVINDSKFIIPEKRKSSKPEFKIYTGRTGFDTLRESSYLFNDDRDDDIMSYTRLLGTNRFR